jgi:hypothetical protein
MSTSTESNEPIVIAATFADRERAHDAVHQLHDEGFGDTWIGVTRGEEVPGVQSIAPGETRVEAENWFARFFGEGNESLTDALARRGVDSANTLESGPFPLGTVVVTVDGLNHPERAAHIITACDGRLLTRGFGATGYGTTGRFETTAASQAPAARTTSLLDDGTSRYPDADAAEAADAVYVPRPTAAFENSGADYDDYGRYRAGQVVDESTRLQLREERMRVDKTPVASGVATGDAPSAGAASTIGLPVVHEEILFERRPMSGEIVHDGRALSADDRVLAAGDVVRFHGGT